MKNKDVSTYPFLYASNAKKPHLLLPSQQRFHNIHFLQKLGCQKPSWDQTRFSSLVNKQVAFNCALYLLWSLHWSVYIYLCVVLIQVLVLVPELCTCSSPSSCLVPCSYTCNCNCTCMGTWTFHLFRSFFFYLLMSL